MLKKGETVILEEFTVSNETEESKEITALRNHLEDMRRLVFEGLMPNILPPKVKEE